VWPHTAFSAVGLTAATRIRLDQEDELAIGWRTPVFGTGFPAPEEPKDRAMPFEHALGLNYEQGVAPTGEHVSQ
jgi:hypothetical protein